MNFDGFWHVFGMFLVCLAQEERHGPSSATVLEACNQLNGVRFASGHYIQVDSQMAKSSIPIFNVW